MEKSRGNWFNNTRLGIIALIMNVLFVIYVGVIQSNDLKNLVMKHDEMIKKLDLQLQTLDDKKVDKETFQLILANLVELRLDIRDIKKSMIDHMNK